MKNLRQLLLGIGASLLSLGLVLGSFAMTFTEGGLERSMIQSATSTYTLVPPLTPGLPLVETSVPGGPPLIQETASVIPTASLAPTEPLPALAGICPPPPSDWSRIAVGSEDTLAGLAQAYGTSVDALRQANCLEGDSLTPGGNLFVPGRPTETPSVACGPPPNWVFYLVQPGDTLSSLSRMFGVRVYDLQLANCMVGQTLIRWGRYLYVPDVPIRTRTPSPTSSPTSTSLPPLESSPTSTATPTRTSIPVISVTPTLTSPPEPSATPTDTPTSTVTPSQTPTYTPTPTWTSTPTATQTLTPTQTDTSAVTATNVGGGTSP